MSMSEWPGQLQVKQRPGGGRDSCDSVPVENRIIFLLLQKKSYLHADVEHVEKFDVDNQRNG